MEYKPGRIRTLKNKVEKNSEIIKDIVDSIVAKYLRELDDIMMNTKELVESLGDDKISDEDLERITLQLPIYYYFACGGLEDLGVESENAGAVKEEIYNKVYLEIEGTIQDKTHGAELKTFEERMVEVAYNRAYKKLKIKLDGIDKTFSAAKKIISKRMKDRDIENRELPYNAR
jgi:hypothetical protein